MYAAIRKYTLQQGALDQTSLEDLKHRLEERFVPAVQEISGFHGYYVVAAGGAQLVSFTVCETQAGVAESTRRAAEFVAQDPMKDKLGKAEVIEGDVLVTKEAPVGAR